MSAATEPDPLGRDEAEFKLSCDVSMAINADESERCKACGIDMALGRCVCLGVGVDTFYVCVACGQALRAGFVAADWIDAAAARLADGGRP